jgi:hypothetical protein
VDLWIEVLSAQGLPPEAMLGFTLTQDFEGDQFTFFKVPLEDLEALYGIRVTELAIFDRPERHVLEQIGRGRLTLLELDSYFLPDTRGVTYRQEHGKTTVAVNRLDLEKRELDYFHNGGFFHLSSEDFDGLFQTNAAPEALPFLPYTEFAKFPAAYPAARDMRETAWKLLRHHFARRPEQNPIRAFAEVFPTQVERLAERDFGFFHKYAFNTLRQVGANVMASSSASRSQASTAGSSAVASGSNFLRVTARASWNWVDFATSEILNACCSGWANALWFSQARWLASSSKLAPICRSVLNAYL